MKSYNKFYYDKNKKSILVNKQLKRIQDYFDLRGHIEPIHDAIRRYATTWKVPIDSLKKIRNWSMQDDTYRELFKAWEEAEFSKELTPVIMRTVKKNGFVIDNLYWSVKKNHSWWNGEIDRLNALRKDMEKRQEENNKTNVDEQKEMLSRLKRIKR